MLFSLISSSPPSSYLLTFFFRFFANWSKYTCITTILVFNTYTPLDTLDT